LIWRAEGLEGGAEGSLEGIGRETGIEGDGAGVSGGRPASRGMERLEEEVAAGGI